MEVCGNYLIDPQSHIGKGGFGFVERINLFNHSKHLCGEYARKNFQPDPDLLAQGVAEDELKRRFRREILYQANLSHPNIVPIYLFDDSVATPYFVMELASCDLDKELKSGNLDLTSKLYIARCILCGLKAIHDKGLIHRDLKPQNILRSISGVYKISDFGLIKEVQGNSGSTVLTAIGQVMGSRRYMSPEILIECDYCIGSDIYAVGRVFEDMGFKSEKKLSLIVDKCIKYDKSQRYTSVDELISALEATQLHQAS